MLTFHEAAQILEGHAGNAVLSNCDAGHKGLHRMRQVGRHESTCSTPQKDEYVRLPEYAPDKQLDRQEFQ